MSDRPLVIDVVDNGGQWTHREWRMLRYLKVDTQIIDNTTPVSELRELDGLILSGGAARVGLSGELGNCGAYLELDIPILGICAGHQFMARHYGGDARESPEPEFGAMDIELVEGGEPSLQGPTPLKRSGNRTTMKFMSFQMASLSQRGALRARSKAWKMKPVIALACNFIPK